MYKWQREAGCPNCACGCGRRVKTPGSKWAHGHARRPLSERFWEKADKSGDCWLWTGAKFKESGYGQFDIDGKKWRANRLAWILANDGADIPEGQFVLHTCDNASCVRPSHLYLGTHRDNVRDTVLRERTASLLTWATVDEMRTLHAAGGWTYAQLGARFGVSVSTVGKVVRHKSWIREAWSSEAT